MFFYFLWLCFYPYSVYEVYWPIFEITTLAQIGNFLEWYQTYILQYTQTPLSMFYHMAHQSFVGAVFFERQPIFLESLSSINIVIWSNRRQVAEIWPNQRCKYHFWCWYPSFNVGIGSFIKYRKKHRLLLINIKWTRTVITGISDDNLND